MRRVHLVEAAEQAGGSMRFISQLPGLSEWSRHTSYRTGQIAKLRNVELITKVTLDAEAVLEYGAEIVVCATGSLWAGDGMSGISHDVVPGADASLSHCATPDQVFAGKQVGDRVVVYDTDGYFMGVSMAQRLAREGRQVSYVTPFETIAPFTEFTLEHVGLNSGLRADGVKISTGHFLSEVSEGSVTINDRWDHAAARMVPIESVVLVTQRRSEDALYRELAASPDALQEAGIEAIYQIGDCVAPALIAEATFSGHRLAREIDSENPAVPLPFIRERQLWQAVR
jgi:dimethylamine/trimethylamine dehydrogenase